jgi:hypothetical protein
MENLLLFHLSLSRSLYRSSIMLVRFRHETNVFSSGSDLYSVKFNNLYAIFFIFHCIGQSTKGEPEPEPEPHYVGAVLA